MDFILTPDTLSARHIRTDITHISGSYGLEDTHLFSLQDIKIGTFSSLLATLKEFWLLADTQDNWFSVLQSSALNMTDAFWSQSIKVDEITVLDQIEASLIHILQVLPLNGQLKSIDSANNHTEKKYNDLVRLHQKMESVFPSELEIARQWYCALQSPSLESINLFYSEEQFCFAPWQQQVIEILKNIQSNSSLNRNVIEQLFKTMDCDNENTFSPMASRLFMQSDTLLKTSEKTLAKPSELKGLMCRDAIVESELISAIINQAVSENNKSDRQDYNNIVVVYPAHSDYPKWLSQSFEINAIPFAYSGSS